MCTILTQEKTLCSCFKERDFFFCTIAKKNDLDEGVKKCEHWSHIDLIKIYEQRWNSVQKIVWEEILSVISGFLGNRSLCWLKNAQASSQKLEISRTFASLMEHPDLDCIRKRSELPPALPDLCKDEESCPPSGINRCFHFFPPWFFHVLCSPDLPVKYRQSRQSKQAFWRWKETSILAS